MKKQYDIWLVNLNPSKGTEAGKVRPAVIIQTNLLNQYNHPSTLVCPITSNCSEKENLLRVKLDQDQTGLEKESEVLVDQIRALDNRRFIQKLGRLDQVKTEELKIKITSILDF